VGPIEKSQLKPRLGRVRSRTCSTELGQTHVESSLVWAGLGQDIKPTLGWGHVKLSWVKSTLGRIKLAWAKVDLSRGEPMFNRVGLGSGQDESNRIRSRL